MSEQEKMSDGSAIGSSVIMVEKTSGSRHKPYRPNELQNETELHHKHPKAPLIVPSVAEELKQLTEESIPFETAEIKDRMECDYAISSDKHKQSIVKKLSSNIERRDQSPESIVLATIEVNRKKGATTPQPIPPDVPATESDIFAEAEKHAAKKADTDSIAEEIVELQTPEVAKKHSEWSDDEEAGGLSRSDSRASRVSRMHKISAAKTKEMSWNDKEYQQKVILKDMVSRPVMERRASVTPFRSTGPYDGHSGISICLPNKSSRYVNQPSGISINFSKKHIASKSQFTHIKCPREQTVTNEEEKSGKRHIHSDVAFTNFVQNIKGKLNNIQCKIRSIFHF